MDKTDAYVAGRLAELEALSYGEAVWDLCSPKKVFQRIWNNLQGCKKGFIPALKGVFGAVMQLVTCPVVLFTVLLYKWGVQHRGWNHENLMKK